MIITSKFLVEWDPDLELYRVESLEDPYCPNCGRLLSGYDRRRRHIIDSDTSSKVWYLLRRYRCSWCNVIHLELPSFMEPRKHYEAEEIQRVRSGDSSRCPAEDSTIRRWKK